jgi:hypothetical protein
MLEPKACRAQLGSASIVPRRPKFLADRWTLNQVQGDVGDDGFGGGDGVVHANTRRREGREKDNFLLFFFAASRLCVINLRVKNSCDGWAGPHLSAMCDKNGLSGHDNIAAIRSIK